MFRDITTLLADPEGLRSLIGQFADRYRGRGIAKVVGIEARGFIIGSPLALELGAGFIPHRKRGKLPYKTIGRDYELEYGADRIEMHVDAVRSGDRVLVVDDLIATGGTAQAACQLVEDVGGEIIECCFAIDLPDLGGRARLELAGYKVFSVMQFEGH
jgi:adenine phosphoribosyltransferase